MHVLCVHLLEITLYIHEHKEFVTVTLQQISRSVSISVLHFFSRTCHSNLTNKTSNKGVFASTCHNVVLKLPEENVSTPYCCFFSAVLTLATGDLRRLALRMLMRDFSSGRGM